MMNLNRVVSQNITPQTNVTHIKEKAMSYAYEEKSVGSTAFFKCEACPYMALAEDDIKFHLFTAHPDLAKSNGLADNVQIPCPGCSSVFDAEETLRTHLRNHHKMGIKDVKKMVKSLVQIALKDAKLKKEDQKGEPLPSATIRPEVADVRIPQVIEIVPDAGIPRNDLLPKGVAFISVDELQNMSTPNFEKVDAKEIIQEASINIVYTNELSTQYVSGSITSTLSNNCNLIQAANVTPDLISSIQPNINNVNNTAHQTTQDLNEPISKSVIRQKPGRPLGARTVRTGNDCKEVDIEMQLGKLCSVDGCHSRLKDDEKLSYHRKCHQNGKLMCLECSKIFLSVELLHTHLWKLHSMDLELNSCNICEFKSYSKHRLQNIHMKCHGKAKDYVCPTCLKAFKNASQLGKHRTIHKGPVECPICQREFSHERSLRLHTKEVHEKSRSFKCSHCDHTAFRKEELKLHLRSHTGDKPYSCDQCKYRSADHNSMRRHKKLHSKQNVYNCKYCSFSSIQSTLFASHMISKHPNVTSKDIHRCPYCPFKSVSKDKYIGHLTNHTDKEGIQLLIDMTKGTTMNALPSWTIPSDTSQGNHTNNKTGETNEEIKQPSPKKNVNTIPIEVYDCDSRQDVSQNYPKSYSTPNSDVQQANYNDQVIVTDLSKDDNNSDCLMSESSNDTMIERHQYPQQHHLQNISYQTTQTSLHFLNPTVTMGQGMLPNIHVNALPTSHSPLATRLSNNIMGNFPIRLPQISVRNNFTLKPVDKIPMPMSKLIGPIIKPTQILPVPLSSNSPVNTIIESDGAPRKKPKISVKSNLILKGPDQDNMFHSQQKMAFKRLEDNERFGLESPVTFNNLITTQFMQLPPEPVLSESPNNIMPYPQEAMLKTATTPVDSGLSDDSQMFNFNQQMSVSSLTMLPPQQKLQTTDPSYIKLEATIKQNSQSPSLERMCNANNIILNNQTISCEYKASPPLEDIHKNMSEIKNEVKSDAFYNIPMANATPNTPLMDQYLLDNIIGEQYPGHMDLNSVLPEINDNQQNDVIEIDDNSDDNKVLPRYVDMSFPLESLYLMHNDFHFLDNEMQPNNLSGEAVNEMSRIVQEVPIINQKENINSSVPSEGSNNEYPNFIQGKKDPMMNTSVRPTTNKINVKNIELMKN